MIDIYTDSDALSKFLSIHAISLASQRSIPRTDCEQMSSYWTSRVPIRDGDYYRPNVTVRLDYPRRPGPHRSDYWRPGRTTTSPERRSRKELDKDPQTYDKTIKPPAKSASCVQSPREHLETPGRRAQIESDVRKPIVRSPDLVCSKRRPVDQLKEHSNEDHFSNKRLKVAPEHTLLKLSHTSRSSALDTTDKVTKVKVKLSKLPDPNLEPLGKRQMGVINSIMRRSGQNSEVSKLNGIQSNQPTHRDSGSARNELNIDEKDSEFDQDTSMFTTEQHAIRRECLNRATLHQSHSFQSNSPSLDPSWTCTSISSNLAISSASDTIESISSTHEIQPPLLPLDLQPSGRQKLDSGNRIDQCLLKMDKWADAWLSNALVDQDSNPDQDNAWNSFEFCLSMPDILEEGEIVEYEEVQRMGLPVDVDATQNYGQAVSVKRKRDELEVDRYGKTNKPKKLRNERYAVDGFDAEVNIPPIPTSPQPEKSSALPSQPSMPSVDHPSWTTIRSQPSSNPPSSSPSPERDDKSIKDIIHIPSAATLRREARARLAK